MEEALVEDERVSILVAQRAEQIEVPEKRKPTQMS